MKRTTKLTTGLITLIAAAAATATPITIDTPDATVIVVRPLDLWSGDSEGLEASLQAHQEKTVHYKIALKDRYILGNPTLTQSATDHPINAKVSQVLAAHGFQLPRNSRNTFYIHPAVSVQLDRVNDVLKLQSSAFEQTTIANGDPDKLQSKTSRNKFFGGLVAVGTMAFAGAKLGAATGLNASAGISEDLFRLASQYKGGMVPVAIEPIDTTKYTAIEFLKVTTSPDRTGQILVAYKNEKTEQAQNAALAQAVVALSGAMATKDEIEQARKSDFKARQLIWADCKSQGLPECKE